MYKYVYDVYDMYRKYNLLTGFTDQLAPFRTFSKCRGNKAFTHYFSSLERNLDKLLRLLNKMKLRTIICVLKSREKKAREKLSRQNREIKYQ